LRENAIKTVKLLRRKFAFSENAFYVCIEIGNDDTSVIPLSKPKLQQSSKEPPILVRAIALRQNPYQKPNLKPQTTKKMKNFTIAVVLLLSSITTFSQVSSCPDYFRRNNGNGICNVGQIKLYFANCPLVAPIIDSVYSNGVKVNVLFALPDVTKCLTANYISYCIIGGNIPPTSTWKLYFHIPGSNYNCTVTEGGTLPVQYLSFDAVVNDKTVSLKWLTTLEVNNSHFEVERSFDMNSYSTVGMVLDGFENGANKSYQYKDNSAELQGKSIAYYRLKQYDIDGKFTYSKVLAVRLQAKTDAVMQVSPNPFVENVNIRFSATENGTAQLRIISITGQTMLSKQSTITKGYNNIQVADLKGLAAGMYVAQLSMNGVVIDNQRLIKN
jgi:Secretion system C-terminal sorting domain